VARKLQNLIRIHQWRVDENRRKLADLQRLLDELLAQARRLEEELVREQRIAAASPGEAGYLYSGYARTVITRRETLAHSIERTEQEVAAARNELHESYRELKKYELTQANRDLMEARATARKETAVLDEIGLQTFIRQRKA
jgi:flagellar FliJ protein